MSRNISEDINAGDKECMLSAMKLFMEHSYPADTLRALSLP